MMSWSSRPGVIVQGDDELVRVIVSEFSAHEIPTCHFPDLWFNATSGKS